MVDRGEFSERITSRECIQAERNGTALDARRGVERPSRMRDKFRGEFPSSTAEFLHQSAL